MLKNIFLLFLVLLAGQAQGFCCYEYYVPSNFYAKVFGGPNFLPRTSISGNHTDYHTGYVIAGSLGFCWRNDWQIEGEYAYRRNGISNMTFVSQGSSNQGHFKTSSYMANLFWNLYSYGDIQGYVGGGVGYDSEKMHATNSLIIFDQTWHKFSWQLMAGLSYRIFCNTKLALEYKFHQGGSHFNNNAIGIALIYSFGRI